MPSRSSRLLLVVVSLLALIPGTSLLRADPPAAAKPLDEKGRAALIADGKKLLAEGDALADQGKLNDAMLRYKDAYAKLLVPMRRLPFKHDVKGELMDRDKLKATLVEKIDEEVPPEEIRAEEAGLKALGLIPMDMDLKATMIQMLTEEIAGFYDPKTKSMHLIKETDVVEGKPAKKPGLLEKLLGGGKGPKAWDKDENKTVIAHEMTHALADQHYDLDKMQERAKGDSDRSTALSALIEGEAVLTMIGAQMQDYEGNDTAAMPAGRLRLMMGLMGPFLTMGSGPSLKEAPPIIRDSLIFPYIQGLIYAATVTNEGSWDALDKAYANPPLSTEQILHPEKYIGPAEKLDPPQAIVFGKLAAPEGWKEAGRNVAGEMGIGVLLDSKSAAAGWDGDTFVVFEGPEKKLALVWATTWDDEDEAKEFAKAMSKHAERHVKNGGDPIGGGKRDPDVTRRQQDGRVYLVRRSGKDVVVIEGFDAKATEAMEQAALAAKKVEKTAAKPSPASGEGVLEGTDVKPKVEGRR